jgi:putative flippase GtrA
LIREFAKKQFARYLIGGIANTIFGYASFVLLIHCFSDQFHYLILLVANFFIAVTFAFFVLKKFVFRSKGGFSGELLKNYLVYGLALIANAVLLVFLVENIDLNVLFAQAICAVATPLLTYFVHRYYTFANRG